MDTSRLQSLFGLEGKRAVVTGGSRGIGYMIADGLLDAGADVIISARKENQVAEAVESLSAKGNIEGIPADLSTDEGLEHLSAEVAQRWDRLDILCNNAGASWGEPIESFSPGGWDKVMNVNVRGVFFLTQKLLPLLRAGANAEDPSRIINTGSVNGLTPPGMDTFSYSSSKAAVHMLTRHLGKELAPDHITVNAIAPGYVRTKNTASLTDDPDRYEAILQRIPAGRWGEPGDIGWTAAFLCSPAAAYINGAVINVDGGWLAR